MVRELWMGATLVALLAGGASATQPAAIAETHTRGTAVDWTVLMPYQRAVLTVSTPDGEVVRSEIGPRSAPTFSAFDEEGEARPDGSYHWELRLDPVLAPDVESELAAALAQGDERAVRKIRRAHGLDPELVQSGTFMLSGGAFVAGREPEPTPGAPAAKLGSVTAADQVINDDLIVRGNACVGAPCLSGMSFGIFPLVVKGPFPYILFDDTSIFAANHDWELIVNNDVFGSNRFSIGNLTTGTIPFTVTGGAPTDSIFVDSRGRVGLGTSTPAAQLHVKHYYPYIRLERTGFAPFFWEIQANHPEAKLHVASFGSGTTDGKLLVKNHHPSTSGRELIEGNNKGTALTVLDDRETAGNRWAFGSAAGGAFLWDNQADPAVEMSLDTAGNLTTTGTVNGVSSREAKTDFAALDPKTTLSRVATLPISIWSYKADGPGVRHAGPMSEDFYQAFQLGQDDKHISFTDSAGIALAAVQGLNQIVQEIVQEKDQEIADLKSRLEALERMVLEQRQQLQR